MPQSSRNQPRALASPEDGQGDRFPAVRPHQLAALRHWEQIRTYAFGQVVVLEVSGRLRDVVEELDLAIQLVLSEGPRGVVCDLSRLLGNAESGAAELLATAGRHVRDWSGVPVAMAIPDPQLRKALSSDPLGRHLIVTERLLSAVSAVLAIPAPVVESLHLAPRPTAARAARDFVTRALPNWRLEGAIPSVCLVASELVTNSTVHARTHIDVSLAWDRGALRLTVRDDSPDLPSQRHLHTDLHGRGLPIAAGLSRAFGVLPTPAGGKVIWAVFDVSDTSPSTGPRHSETATTGKDHTSANAGVTAEARAKKPRRAKLLTVARVGRTPGSPSHPYNDSSNYLG